MDKVASAIFTSVVSGLILLAFTALFTKSAQAATVGGACGCCAGAVASAIKQ